MLSKYEVFSVTVHFYCSAQSELGKGGQRRATAWEQSWTVWFLLLISQSVHEGVISALTGC